MPKYDWAGTRSATSGSTFTIPNGGYVLKILTAEFGKSRAGDDMLSITWDVAEGPHRDVAAVNAWYPSKHADYISFSPKALGFAKRKLESIQKSNPGFDPFTAVDNDAFSAFEGRIFGAVLKVEYGEWNGRQTTKMVIDKWLSADDVRNGNFTVPETEEPPIQSKPTPTYNAASSYADEGIPF